MRKAVYLLGIRHWNDEILDRFAFLMESQFWDIDKLLAYQLDKLKKLIDIAYNKCPYYKHKFDFHNIRPDDIKKIEDIKKIPVMVKDELLKNRDLIQLSVKDKRYFAETSGSTGEPLIFYRDKEWDAWMRASLFRGYAWHGVEPWERNGFLWGYNFSPMKQLKVKILDELQNRFRLFSYKKKEFDGFLKKLEKASFISGYSSMIFELSKEINKRGSSKLYKIKMVMGASEKIFDGYQEEVKKAFGLKMINEYGAAEGGMIAFECPEGNMHVNMETNIVEEENNEILITNLTSGSFPIIRYKLGDYVDLDFKTECKCGRRHYIVKEVLGRTGKVIYGIENKYPSLTLYYVFKNLALNHKIVLNYVAVQNKKGEIELYIDKKIGNDVIALLKTEYHKYFKEDLGMVLKNGESYKLDNKKKMDFISFVE